MFAIEYSQGIEDAFGNVAEFVPRLLAFLAILVIGYFVAKILAKVADGVLERVGFDEAVERGGVRQALEKSKYDPSDLIAKVVKYAVMLFVLQAAFGVFGTNPISDLITDVVAYLPNVIVAIILIVVAAAIAAAVKDLIQNSLSGYSYGNIVASGASIAILVIAGFAVLDQLQIAESIVNQLFTALLVAVVGTTVIGVGGASIVELRPYIRRALERADQEASSARDGAEEAGGRQSGRPLTAEP